VASFGPRKQTLAVLIGSDGLPLDRTASFGDIEIEGPAPTHRATVSSRHCRTTRRAGPPIWGLFQRYAFPVSTAHGPGDFAMLIGHHALLDLRQSSVRQRLKWPAPFFTQSETWHGNVLKQARLCCFSASATIVVATLEET
jgi:hypothetical protein